MPNKYELAIIGSGGEVLAVAIHARTLGKLVVTIERETLSGTFTNIDRAPS